MKPVSGSKVRNANQYWLQGMLLMQVIPLSQHEASQRRNRAKHLFTNLTNAISVVTAESNVLHRPIKDLNAGFLWISIQPSSITTPTKLEKISHLHSTNASWITN